MGSTLEPAAFGKVAVLMGGRSAEREISLNSGQAVLKALQAGGVNAVGIDAADDDLLERLAGEGYDRVFNVLHGRGGEDGVMQGVLQTLGLPYTGSGVLGSALSMDKLRTKQVWQGTGLPTPAFGIIRAEEDLDGIASAVGFPMMIKPICEGSSIGMSKVDSPDQLLEAWQQAHVYDDWVLAERWVVGREYTASILDGECLPLIRLETPHTFYDYEAKYQADNTEYHCPCGLPAGQEQAYQALALRAFEMVDASGWGRVDFMVDEADEPWLIEVNTVPGMTDHSLVPMAAKAAGVNFNELVLGILNASVRGVSGA